MYLLCKVNGQELSPFPIFLDDVLLLEITNQLSIEKCFSPTPLNGLVYDFYLGW